MRKAVVVGAGPAGISAAVYLVRSGIEVTVIYRDKGALGKTNHIANYYGFPETITGTELFERGVLQAKNLGVRVVEDEVVALEYGDANLCVRTNGGEYGGDVVILATGASRMAPKIEGLKTFEGRGVSYCAVCDAFFYRGKEVVVIGNGSYAFHEARVLAQTSKSVRIVTMGLEPTFHVEECAQNIEIDKRKVVCIQGNDCVESIAFDDGSCLSVAGVFLAIGVAGSADFAKKVGAETDGPRILTDENCATTVPGLYVVGDCNGGMLQIAKAVYEGAKAALHAVKAMKAAEKATEA